MLSSTDEPLFVEPSNIEAEQAVVGSALVSNGVLAACGFLHVEHFFEPVHGRIWKALRRRHESGQVGDPVTLREAFERDPALRELGGAKYLGDLCRSARTIMDAAEYARTIVALARKRKLAAAARGILARISDAPESDAAEIFGEFQADLDAAVLDTARRQGQTLKQIALDVAEEVRNPPEVFSTGIPALDWSIGGEPVRLPSGRWGSVPFGYLIGLEARPASFKTGLALTIAINAALAGVETTYLALEMGKRRLGKRGLGHLGGFGKEVFRHDTDETHRLLVKAMGEAPDALVIEDCQGFRLGQVMQVASEHRRRRGSRLFIVDYFQQIEPDGKIDNRQQHLENIAYKCQSTAYRNNETWVLCSQQNREGYALGGDGLLRAADWVGILNKNESRRLPRVGNVETIWIEVNKARDGSCEAVGSAEEPKLYINPFGPHLAELPR